MSAIEEKINKMTIDNRKYNGNRCDYKCPYYMDGAVLSLCTKYHEQPQYNYKLHGPERTKSCKEDIQNLTKYDQ